MPTFHGRTSTSASSSPYNIASKIKFVIIVNETGGAIVVNFGIFYGSTFDISPYNLSIAAGGSYTSDAEILIPANYYLIISSSGTISYYVTIE